jgi:proline dehydrogenase
VNLFDKLAAASLPLVPRPIVRRLSRRYIAGEHRADALRAGRKLEKAGYAITYDVLGEAVKDQQDVNLAVQEYQALLQDIAEEGLELNISLKPTQMGLLLDEKICVEAVEELAQQAKGHGAFIRFEMEDSSTVDATLRVFQQLREAYGETLGCVIQSMLRRSEDDVRTLLKNSGPLNVRLVKGIYVEPAEIAFQSPEDVNDSFLRIFRLLLEGGAFVGAATHDSVLIQGIQKILSELPEAAHRCEIQMLLGVQEELRQSLREQDFPVRVYIPYGTQWHPYVVRRLRKNPKLARYAFFGMFKKKEKL